MEIFTKYTLSFLGFCAVQMLCFIPLAGMQSQEEKIIQADFLKKIEERDLAGVKDLVQSGKINEKMLSAGYDWAEQLKIETESQRDKEIERSEKWLNLNNNKYELYKSIADYLNNIDHKLFKIYRKKTSASAGSVSSTESSMSCLASSAFAPVSSSNEIAKIPLADIINDVLHGRPANTQSSMSCLAQPSIAPVMSSSSQTMHEAVFSNSSAPAITVQSSSSLPSIAESADEGLQHGVMMSLAPTNANLIPDAEEQAPSMHTEQSSNCFYTLLCALWYYMTVACHKEKSV